MRISKTWVLPLKITFQANNHFLTKIRQFSKSLLHKQLSQKQELIKQNYGHFLIQHAQTNQKVKITVEPCT